MGGAGLGALGLLLALFPGLWVSVFTRDPGVAAAAEPYLRFAGPAFVFFGLNLSLYFASQGAGKIGGPLLAGTLRLIVIALGGWFLVSTGAPDWSLFALVAAGMVTAGAATVAFVAMTPWGPKAR
jgi:Na+-driven multidrug efflux pump